ncbi:MAG TPA: chemotaxis protein CheD [Roseiarcus sp.]|nr:chemotaxis protein CheD [Roseiarcus sp.]
MKAEPAPERRVNIVQGEYCVGDGEDLALTTVLGSCVAACLHDPQARIGGMNHFLLPGDDRDFNPRDAERYGVHLMELLVNGLMQLGARRDRLQAKIFGGAKVVRGLSDVGRKNGEFAERFLRYEGIAIVSQDLGGERGRRLQFWPASGRARRSFITDAAVITVEHVRKPIVSECGDVELFSDEPDERIARRA